MLIAKKLRIGQSTEEYNPCDYWTRVAREVKQRSYDSILAGDDSPFIRYKRDMFVMKFLDQIPVQGKAVLEVGCGPGGNLARIAKAQPRKLMGCDISEEMITLAQKNTRGLEGVDTVLTNGTSLPFPDRSFDVTFTAVVLQHTPDTILTKLLPEICRVTADRLYLFEDTAWFKLEWFSYILRPVNEYTTLCASEGFDLITADRLGLYVSTGLHYALRAASIFLNHHQEGAAMPKAYNLLERAGLSITKPLDNVVKLPFVLSRMIFRRKP